MGEFKGTPGPWKTIPVLGITRVWQGVAALDGTSLLTIVEEDGVRFAVVWDDDDAQLIADAGTAMDRTGFGPMQLADQRDALLAALQVTTEWMQWWLTEEMCECEGGHICGKTQRQAELDAARAAIKKALGE